MITPEMSKLPNLEVMHNVEESRFYEVLKKYLDILQLVTIAKLVSVT